MPWQGHKALFCRSCGRHRDEVGPMSARFKCAACGEGRSLTNQRELHAHTGPSFDHWRRRCLAAFGVVTLDEADEQG